MYNSIEETKKSVLDDMCQEIDKICSLLTISIDEFKSHLTNIKISNFMYWFTLFQYFS